MKRIATITAVLVIVLAAICGAQKLSEMTKTNSLSADDLTLVTVDPNGIPLTRVVTLDVLRNWITSGLTIGADVQGYDSDLTIWAGLTPSAFFQTLVAQATAAALCSVIGMGTEDSPQFAAVNIGHATDTTITRPGAGDIAVEGNTIYRAGGTDIPVTDGGTGASTVLTAKASLHLDHVVDVRDYGAVGNGSTDDAAAIQAAALAAQAAKSTLFFPAGTYKITDAINVDGLLVRGSGMANTIIKQYGAAFAFICGTTSDYVILENLELQGTATATGGADFGSSSIGRMSNCRVIGFTTGIGVKVDTSFRMMLDHVYVTTCATGLYLADNTTFLMQHSYIDECTVHAVDTGGMYVEASFHDCYFESNSGNITLDFTPPSNVRVTLDTCGFEANGGTTASPVNINHDGIWPLTAAHCSFSSWSDTFTGTASDIKIRGTLTTVRNCKFIQNAAASRYFLDVLGSGIQVIREGNQYQSSGVTAATLNSDYLYYSATYPANVSINNDQIYGSGGSLIMLGMDTINVNIGVDGVTRGTLTLWDGASGNTPGYIKIHSPNGTSWYLFVEDDGTVKVHNAVPAANTDGSAVGGQS